MKIKPILLLNLLSIVFISSCGVNRSPVTSNSSENQSSINSPSHGGQTSSQGGTTSSSSNQNFTGITFSNGAFNYDGQPHSIYVNGAPDFATVTYTNNNKTNVGSYTVTAKVSAEGYNTLTKTATLRIIGQEITGITFENSTVTYDGNPHSIQISGELPSGVNVSYTNNNKTESGTYTVTANLSGTGYEPLKLTATLTIEPIPLDKPGYFYSKGYIYDGKDHSITVDYEPKYSTVTYKCLNASGTNTFKNPGFYLVEATIKTDANHLSKKTAALIIANEPTSSVDSSKTPLTIDENLTWDQLYSALGNDNFTMEYLNGSYDVANIDDPRPTDLFETSCTVHSLGHIFASDGKEAYQYSYYLNKSDPETSYDYYKEVGNDIVHLELGGSTHDGYLNKMPKEAFSETVCKYTSEDAFVALTKGDNGEFLPGIDDDDSYGDTGAAFIQNGTFIVLMEHPRLLSSGDYRYFYRIFKFYNIGNTTVSIPSNFLPSQDYINNDLGIDNCILGGVEYSTAIYDSTSTNPKYYYAAKLYVSYERAVYMKPGTYYVLPRIYNRKVEAIIYTQSSNDYKTNQSGYNFRLYIDSSGAYQGEYSELGSIAKNDIYNFTKRGGTVEYYDQWHE